MGYGRRGDVPGHALILAQPMPGPYPGPFPSGHGPAPGTERGAALHPEFPQPLAPGEQLRAGRQNRAPRTCRRPRAACPHKGRGTRQSASLQLSLPSARVEKRTAPRSPASLRVRAESRNRVRPGARTRRWRDQPARLPAHRFRRHHPPAARTRLRSSQCCQSSRGLPIRDARGGTPPVRFPFQTQIHHSVLRFGGRDNPHQPTMQRPHNPRVSAKHWS